MKAVQQQTYPSEPSLWQRNYQYVRDHWIVFLVFVAGAVASIYFGFWPKYPHRELTYAIQPVRTAIARVSQPSDITVIYKGNTITGDLIAAQVRISNAGKEPIEGNDILSPISLVVSNAKIVECSISVPAKQGTEFVINSNVAVPLDRTNLSWKILERGDNPVIQVLYAGKADSPIYLEGRIKGQDQIMQASWPSVGIKKRTVPLRNAVVLWIVTGVLAAFAGRWAAHGRTRLRRLIIGVLVIIGLAGVAIVGYWLASR